MPSPFVAHRYPAKVRPCESFQRVRTVRRFSYLETVKIPARELVQVTYYFRLCLRSTRHPRGPSTATEQRTTMTYPPRVLHPRHTVVSDLHTAFTGRSRAERDISCSLPYANIVRFASSFASILQLLSQQVSFIPSTRRQGDSRQGRE